jgi:hypothetical protein
MGRPNVKKLYFSERVKELSNYLRIMFRTVLIAAFATALLVILVNGGARYELYYFLYAFMYGLIPSVVVLVVVTLYRMAVRQPVWAFLKVEILLGLLTLLAILCPFILMYLKVLTSF